MYEGTIENEISQKASADPAFLSDLLSDPKGALSREYGVDLPEDIQIEVRQDRPGRVRIHLPSVGALSPQISDEELQGISAAAPPKQCTSWWTQTTC